MTISRPVRGKKPLVSARLFSEKQTGPLTGFQQKVYEAVKKIPKGQVRTYKQIAKAIGRPKAYRAVGNALNKNPDLKTIPCHRVVRSDGKVGGYRYGTRRKQKLLRQEGAID